jgi:hypothetical protein
LFLRKQQENPQRIGALLQKAGTQITAQEDGKIYGRFDEVYDVLSTEYADQAKLDSGAMRESAVKAFVDSIDDPYTVYMDSSQNSGFNEALK